VRPPASAVRLHTPMPLVSCSRTCSAGRAGSRSPTWNEIEEASDESRVWSAGRRRRDCCELCPQPRTRPRRLAAGASKSTWSSPRRGVDVPRDDQKFSTLVRAPGIRRAPSVAVTGPPSDRLVWRAAGTSEALEIHTIWASCTSLPQTFQSRSTLHAVRQPAFCSAPSMVGLRSVPACRARLEHEDMRPIGLSATTLATEKSTALRG